eukprot:m.31272 g.31272  ORF g.31272 m.31272 type:complete len:2222 (+) comp9402_c2_seq2:284-6949(+)
MDLFRSLQNSFLPGIKNKLVRVIIHKSIGKFLKYKLQSDQVQITDTNSFRLTGLELDVKYLNAFLVNTPFRIHSGLIDIVEGYIPYTQLLHEGCSLRVQGLDLVLVCAEHTPVHASAESVQAVVDSFGTLIEDMEQSLSEGLAAEGATTKDFDEGSSEEGLQGLTYLVKSIMSRFIGSLADVRIFLLPTTLEAANLADSVDVPSTEPCDALVLHIASLDFRDTTSDTCVDSSQTSLDLAVSAVMHKTMQLSGLRFCLLHLPKGELPSELLDSRESDGIPFLVPREPDSQDKIEIMFRPEPCPHQPRVQVSVFCPGYHLFIDPEVVSSVVALQNALDKGTVGSDQPDTLPSPRRPGRSMSEDGSDAVKVSISLKQMSATVVYGHTTHDERLRILSGPYAQSVDATKPEWATAFMKSIKQDHLQMLLSTSTVRLAFGDSLQPDTHLSIKALKVCEYSAQGIACKPVLIMPYEAGHHAMTKEQMLETLERGRQVAVDMVFHAKPTPDAVNTTISLSPLEFSLDFTLIDRLALILRAMQPVATSFPAPLPTQPIREPPSSAHIGTSLAILCPLLRVICRPPVPLCVPVPDFVPGTDKVPPSIRPYRRDAFFVFVQDMSATLLPSMVVNAVTSCLRRGFSGSDVPSEWPQLFLEQMLIKSSFSHLSAGLLQQHRCFYLIEAKPPVKVQQDSDEVSTSASQRSATVAGAASASSLHTERAGTFQVLLRNNPESTYPPGQRLFNFELPSSIQAQHHSGASRDFLHPASASGLASFVDAAWAGASICIEFDIEVLHLDLPRELLTRFYQLITDFTEWSPWEPPCSGRDSPCHEVTPPTPVPSVPPSSTGHKAKRQAKKCVRFADDTCTSGKGSATSASQRSIASDSDSELDELEASITAGWSQSAHLPEQQPESALEFAAMTSFATSFDGLDDRYGGSESEASEADIETLSFLRHMACVLVEFQSGNLLLTEQDLPNLKGQVHEATFDMALKRGHLVLVNGINGTKETSLVLQAEDVNLSQLDPPALERTALVSHKQQTGTYTLAPQQLSLVMEVRPPSKGRISTETDICLQLSDCLFHHRLDANGHFLMRMLDVIDLKDPADWPKSQHASHSKMTLAVTLNETQLEYRPLYISPMARVDLPSLHVSSHVVSNTPHTVLTLYLDGLSIKLLNTAERLRTQYAHDLWLLQGWREVVSLSYIQATVNTCSDGSSPDLDLEVVNRPACVSLCGDSLVTLIDLATYVAEDKDLGAPPAETVEDEVEHVFVSPNGRVRQRTELLQAEPPASSVSEEVRGSETAATLLVEPDKDATGTPPDVVHQASSEADSEDEFHEAEGSEQQSHIVSASGVDGWSGDKDAKSAASTGYKTQGSGYDVCEFGTDDGGARVEAKRRSEYGSALDDRDEEDDESEEEGDMFKSLAPQPGPVFIEQPSLKATSRTQRFDDATVTSGPSLDHDTFARMMQSALFTEDSDLDQDTDSEPDASDIADTDAWARHVTPSAAQRASQTPYVAPTLEDELFLQASYFGSAPTFGEALTSDSEEEEEGLGEYKEDYFERVDVSDDELTCAADMAQPTVYMEENVQVRTAPNLEDELMRSMRDLAEDSSEFPDEEHHAPVQSTHPKLLGSPQVQPAASSAASFATDVSTRREYGSRPAKNSGAALSGTSAGSQYTLRPAKPIHVISNYFKAPQVQIDRNLKAHDFLLPPIFHVLLKKLHVSLQLHVGNDWVHIKAEEEMHQAEAHLADSEDWVFQARQLDSFVRLSLIDFSVSYDQYQENQPYADRLLVLVRDIFAEDCIPQSVIQTMLAPYETKYEPREKGSSVLRIELMKIRMPGVQSSEGPAWHSDHVLGISVLPLRLNLDQDTLTFLIGFMTRGVVDKAISKDWVLVDEDLDDNQPVGGTSADVLSTNDGTDGIGHAVNGAEATLTSSWEGGDATPLEESSHEASFVESDGDDLSPTNSSPSASEAASTTYFKLVKCSPLVILVDYEPKSLNVSSLLRGHVSEVAGLISLHDAALRFPSLALTNLMGWPDVIDRIAQEYMSALTQTQKLNLFVATVPGGHNIKNVMAAGMDALHQPVEQYPYVLHGLRDGVFGGITATLVESCSVATTMLYAMQGALELVHSATTIQARQVPRHKLAQQPEGVKDGLYRAYATVANSFKEASNDLSDALSGEASSGPTALMKALGAVPGAGLRPVIGACHAAALTLQGIRNSLNPEKRETLQQKFKPSSS